MSNLRKSHRIITAHQAIACGEQPLTGLDLVIPVDSFCIALVYSTPLEEPRLIASLQKTLDQIPYFSGRLFGIGSTLPLAIPNNEGALFFLQHQHGIHARFRHRPSTETPSA